MIYIGGLDCNGKQREGGCRIYGLHGEYSIYCFLSKLLIV
jgi:hypothetical protein